ncbi:TPA: DapH/DapD/GlmU-related protein [Clostridium perfringens]|nr:acyltransferase [Clostridium perfringens]MDU2445118.1 acyltransferase [Clostridium perfringens]
MQIFNKLINLFRKDINIPKLKARGLKIGEGNHIGRNCFLDPSHCFLIKIGDNCTFSFNVSILAHDASTKKLFNYTKIGCVEVGNNVFIGANTTVLPNVRIGNNSIVGAGSVVVHSIPNDEVWAGNPARFICTLDEYRDKFKNIPKENYFDESFTFDGGITNEKKKQMKEALKSNIGFVI